MSMVGVAIDNEIANRPFCSDALDECVWVDFESVSEREKGEAKE